ncbi:MAG: 4Fe-4S binding protein [Clostridia bacterium]|nr:4Fe-4S binding protein [Clostridia bacterium]
MQITDFFRIIQEDIHSTVVATVDSNNLPVTCAIDIMDYDIDGLYFLTARGKNFYERLKRQGYLALTGMKGDDTMHSISVSVRGSVREIGTHRLGMLFQKNPYMNEIYPDEKSQSALTVFQIFKGTGELFDLSKKPIERQSFVFGGAINEKNGYYVMDKCTGCGKCLTVCPQKCIDITIQPVRINQTNCLHCGNCATICSFNAIEKRG